MIYSIYEYNDDLYIGEDSVGILNNKRNYLVKIGNKDKILRTNKDGYMFTNDNLNHAVAMSFNDKEFEKFKFVENISSNLSEIISYMLKDWIRILNGNSRW